MTVRSLARRYAQALFDVLRQKGQAQDASEQLAILGDAVKGHAELRRVLENPAIASDKKQAIAEGLLAAAGDVRIEVRRLVQMLARRDRLAILPAVADAYRALAQQASRVMPAEIVTATPLTEESRAALRSALGRATGGDIRLTERVDPAIIGGVVATVGSLVFDGSVTSQLERLRQKLRAQV